MEFSCLSYRIWVDFQYHIWILDKMCIVDVENSLFEEFFHIKSWQREEVNCKKKYIGQFFLRSESGHKFKWFCQKKQNSDWLTYLIYQLHTCFLGSKPLELMSWLESQKKLTLIIWNKFYPYPVTLFLTAFIPS